MGDENTLTEDFTSGNATDEIAGLLIDEQEQEEKPEPKKSSKKAINEKETEDQEGAVDESEGEETPPEDSTEEPEESDESDDVVTWEKALGLEEGILKYDDEGNPIGVIAKIDGITEEVPFKDLVIGYQTNKFNTHKSQQIEARRKEFEQTVSAVQQDYTQKLENLEAVTNYIGNKLVEDFQNVDWNLLRQQDPAEYAALKSDYETRINEIQQAMNAVAEEKQTLQQTQMSKSASQHKAFVDNQREIMYTKNPTWRDPTVFKKDMGEIRNFLSEHYGFTEQDFNQVYDARLIELAKDVKAFHNSKKVAEKKLVKPVPKFQKPTSKSAKRTSKLDRLTKQAKAAQGANKRDLQSEAIAELLMTGEK